MLQQQKRNRTTLLPHHPAQPEAFTISTNGYSGAPDQTQEPAILFSFFCLSCPVHQCVPVAQIQNIPGLRSSHHPGPACWHFSFGSQQRPNNWSLSSVSHSKLSQTILPSVQNTVTSLTLDDELPNPALLEPKQPSCCFISHLQNQSCWLPACTQLSPSRMLSAFFSPWLPFLLKSYIFTYLYNK